MCKAFKTTVECQELGIEICPRLKVANETKETKIKKIQMHQYSHKKN